MAANSALRRAVKRLLVRAIPERLYSYVQALVMAADIRSGRLSEPELGVLPVAVLPGDIAIDIGANYGLYSYHLSRAVGTTGRVYAFEPIPFTYHSLRLVARILRMRNVEAFAKGCSDRTGPCVFRVPLQDSGAIAAGLAHIRPEPASDDMHSMGGRGTREIAADLVALDEFLPPLPDVSFVKCDIEGAELYAFKGFERTIATHSPTVVCEIEQRHLSRFGLRREQVFAFFAEHGYRSFVWQDGGLRDADSSGAVPEGNVIFVHPRRLARVASLVYGERSSS